MPPTVEDEDDTIVVKGEYGSHPSSLESLSPETRPLVSHRLPQANDEQHLESPETYQETADPDHSDTRGEQVSSRRTKANVTTMEDRLQNMPEIRPLPWRPGVEEGADIETGGESRRKQIRFGCLLASRGEVREPGCNSCVNGRGKFRLCIALDGYFKGACASCQLSGRPNRCSIKKEDDPISAVGTPDGDTSLNQGQLATPSSDSRPSAHPRKRRRTSEVKRAIEMKNASPKAVSQWTPPSQQLPPPPPPPPPPSHPPHPPPSRLPHYQPVQWGQQTSLPPPIQPQSQPHPAHEIPQKTWAAVNQPLPKPPPPSNGSHNGHSVQEQYRPASTGWATVNQPQPQSRSLPQPHPYPLPPQPGPPVQRPMPNGGEIHGNGFYSSLEREKREPTVGNEEGSGALIDGLPKAKQRQVYGLISGLQGGIEHLQRELDALKRAIGIDDEN